MNKLVAAFVIIFLCSFALIGQESDRTPNQLIAEIHLAKDDGTGKPGKEATEFLVTDVPIHCVVQLNSAKPATVRMILIAAAVAGIKPETKVVSTTYTTTENQDRVNFSGKPHGKWVIGKYRVDIFVNEELSESLFFTVQRDPVAIPIKENKPPKSDRKVRLAGSPRKL